MSARGAYRPRQGAGLSSLGGRIRAIRIAWGWNQQDLAAQVGVDQRTLSSWERGINQPPDPALELLAALFGLATPALRTGRGFSIPDTPPAGVAEGQLAYLALAPPSQTGIWVIDRHRGSREELGSTHACSALKEARKAGRPVWIIIG